MDYRFSSLFFSTISTRRFEELLHYWLCRVRYKALYKAFILILFYSFHLQEGELFENESYYQSFVDLMRRHQLCKSYLQCNAQNSWNGGKSFQEISKKIIAALEVQIQKEVNEIPSTHGLAQHVPKGTLHQKTPFNQLKPVI